MTVRIKLSDGTEVIVEATVDEMTKAMKAATETGTVVKIEQPAGTIFAISPQAIETIQEEPQAEPALAQSFAQAAAGH